MFVYLLHFVAMVHFMMYHSIKLNQLWIRKMMQHKHQKRIKTQTSKNKTNHSYNTRYGTNKDK